jgi:two-component system, OmpR family, sensor histidine kinase KdpD
MWWSGLPIQAEIFLLIQLLEKFEILPQHVITSSGMTYQGMDLDQVLARQPQLVVVDHMARTNPPGLRHVARYLDVEELLDAGIDVYTTLNIYQVESQVDAVSYLTGVSVRETLSDRFLDHADQLRDGRRTLRRFSWTATRRGKISVAPRVESQMEKFFQPANLFALRELALRYVARRSNDFMRAHMKSQETGRVEMSPAKLLVCLGDSPSGGRLVRAGRRMADETRADWVVLHVETPQQAEQAEESQMIVAQHIRLAEMLGARTEIVPGRNVAEAVRDYARKHHFRRVMVGGTPRGRLQSLFGAPLAEQLLRDDPSMNVYVVGSDFTPRPFQVPGFWKWLSRAQLLGVLGLVLAPTLLGMVLTPTIISRSANLIMLYLLAVVIASTMLGLVPALLTAVLSVLAFDFLLCPAGI